MVFTNSYFLNFPSETIGEFLDHYNLVIHVLNSYSRMGLSDVQQAPSPIEKYEQIQQELTNNVGIADLKEDRP